MSRSLHIKDLPPEITLDKLIIYFQSESKSGGGDVDSEACKWDGNKAVVVFEKTEDLDRVLQRKHEIEGHKLDISNTPFKPKPVPRKRTKVPAPEKEEIQNNDKTYLGEVRTVIVSDLGQDTTDETIHMFFENKRRSGGGAIEKFDRCQPTVAHITFVSTEVASRVLKNNKLELEGYLLKLVEKQPELVLPLDKKKLYVKNIDPKTTKDGLMNYIEVITKKDVCNVQFGDDRNALIDLNEEPDMKKVSENKKLLEGAVLTISNPPVCNSILITGLSKNTTKQAIEMYFENEKNGGGKIYGDIIYQNDKGNAVVSFCDPNVVNKLGKREQKLNGATLSMQQYYPFMKTFKETSTKKMKLKVEVVDHILKKCKSEFRDLFGDEMLEMLTKSKEELILPVESEKELQKYMNQFTTEEISFSKKLLENSKKELTLMITELSKYNSTATMDENLACIKLVGNEDDVKGTFESVQAKINEFEEKLNVVTKDLHLPGHRLELFLHHGFGEMIKSKFNVEVEITPRDENMTIKGSENTVVLAETFVYQKCAKIGEDLIEITEMKRRFLQSHGLDMLNSGMKEKGLKGIVSLSESKLNIAKVLNLEGTTVEDIHSFVSNNMFEESYELDEDNLTLLESNKWKEFYEDVTTNTTVRIYTAAISPSEISLIGKKIEVKQALEKLNEFMRKNTIISESIHLGEGNTGFLAEFCNNDLQDIVKKLEEQFVRVRTEDGSIIVIDGTKEGVKEAKRLLQDIVSSIAKGTICFENLRMQTYLASEEGKIFLAGIESAHKCLIRLTKDDGESSTIIPSNRSTPLENKPSSQLLCSYETREKISLQVYKADITVHGCDVIVNAANGDLRHIGGVAKSILDAGGKEIQDECDAYIKEEGTLFEGEYYSGSPGKLPCKRLIHAVGPRWDSSRREQKKKILKVTCMRVLQEAKDYRSIALPAIGSGIYGIPKDVCADIMIEVAEEFSKEHGDCSLKEIHFVNVDDASGQEFVRKFRSRFAGESSFKDNKANITRSTFRPSKTRFRAKEKKQEAPSAANEVQPKRKPDDCIITKTKMKISVIVGDLSTFKADVLVNTTGENLQLDSNPCGKALSNEAGPALQAECTKIGQIQVGEVAVTQGGNLLCDKVYHVVCTQWNGGQGEQVLRTIIKNCLKKASSNRKKSIAFPAIGTGILGFPHDIAAKIFFEETKEFAQRLPNCSINDVSFVVYNQDAKSIEAFQTALKKQAEWGKNESDTNIPDNLPKNVSLKKRRRKQNSKFTDATAEHSLPASFSKVDENEENSLCIRVGEDKEIEIVKGDITKETTDVIAHLSNTDLSLSGGVAKALTISAGEELERECKDKVSSAKISTTVLTKAGQLNAMYVAHMVAPNNPNPNDIEKCIKNCLKVVNKEGCQSISFPAVGTGILSLDPKKAAKMILASILSSLQSSSETVTTVRIVLKDDDLIKAFQEAVKQLNQEEDPGMWRKFVNFLWNTDSAPINVTEKPPTNTKKLFLEIYARDVKTVKLAEENIHKIMESQKKKKKIEDENIDKLSDQQITEIKHLCKTSDIKITIEKDLNRIILIGHNEDITNLVTKIYKILKQIGEEMKEKEKADLSADLADIVSQGVQWFWVDSDDGDSVEYDKDTNATIEKAYKKQEKSVIFIAEEGKCEIVFAKMEEKNLETSDTVKVVRKDLKAEVSVPDYWDTQPRDANGKELVHLVSLDPNNPNHKEEYKRVSDQFCQTQNSPIHQIQRIQNPALFKQYLMKKKSLDEKNGSNEKTLFHGTKGDKLKEINENGLNRNYAGINGIAFGKGVYFARDASLSASYAPVYPATRRRYMYVVRVAVGDYTVGNQSMLVPPSKGGNANDSYDSTVNNTANPTIFVTFYDYQYYPEYLITFS